MTAAPVTAPPSTSGLLPTQAALAVLDGPHRRAPETDIGAGPALLARAVASGGRYLRLYRPRPTTALSRLDVLRPGAADAVRRSTAAGFTPVLRAPGGHAAAYHEQALCLDLAAADPDPRSGILARFQQVAALVVDALRALDVPAEVGPVPDEYCPGQHSVRAGGVKLAGTAQRVVRGGWLVSAVVVVGGSQRLRDVIGPVYDALGLPCDVATVGAAEDVVPGLDVAAVSAALLERLAATTAVVPDVAPHDWLDDAHLHRPTHPVLATDGVPDQARPA